MYTCITKPPHNGVTRGRGKRECMYNLRTTKKMQLNCVNKQGGKCLWLLPQYSNAPIKEAYQWYSTTLSLFTLQYYMVTNKCRNFKSKNSIFVCRNWRPQNFKIHANNYLCKTSVASHNCCIMQLTIAKVCCLWGSGRPLLYTWSSSRYKHSLYSRSCLGQNQYTVR